MLFAWKELLCDVFFYFRFANKDAVWGKSYHIMHNMLVTDGIVIRACQHRPRFGKHVCLAESALCRMFMLPIRECIHNIHMFAIWKGISIFPFQSMGTIDVMELLVWHCQREHAHARPPNSILYTFMLNSKRELWRRRQHQQQQKLDYLTMYVPTMLMVLSTVCIYYMHANCSADAQTLNTWKTWCEAFQ